MDTPKSLIKKIRRQIRDKDISIRLEIVKAEYEIKNGKRNGNVILRKGTHINVTG